MRSLFDDPQAIAVPPAGSLAARLRPRPYQAEADANFYAAYADGARGMLYRLATGCGKTYAAALTAERWIAADPDRRRVMVIAYERQLVRQLRDELRAFLPDVDIGLEMSSDGQVSPDFVPHVTVASRATLGLDAENRSRLFKFDPLGFEWLLVLDEAHGWTYGLVSCRHVLEWFDQNPANARLCLSATPARGDGVALSRLCPEVCVELPLGRAIDEGWLVPFRQRFVTVEGVDFKNLREVAGDFDDAQLDEILSEREQLISMIGPLLDMVEDRQTLIFNPGVGCAKAVARTINAEIEARGLKLGAAEWMAGETPDDVREDITDRHKRAEFQFLSVCGLCRAGYDDPGIRCVAIFRPTKSRPWAEQMKGRGVRPVRGLLNLLGDATPDERKAAIAASAKPDCLVVDLVGVSGMPEVASTAHLYAIGEPDEVIDRANERLAEPGNEETVEQAVAKAKAEIAEERELARREREERERREAEEARRRAKIEARVNYSARDVAGAADGGAHVDFDSLTPRATDGQVRVLVGLGWREDAARRLTRKQASAVIAKGVRKAGPADRSKPAVDPNGPPTPSQVRVLERHGRDVPATFTEAAAVIVNLDPRELAAR